jgi:inositol-pentakisphosphate 2-kinase
MHVKVSMGFLESVEKNVICQRPAGRVDTAQVDMHCDYVLLMSDHSLFTHGIEMSFSGLASIFMNFMQTGF